MVRNAYLNVFSSRFCGAAAEERQVWRTFCYFNSPPSIAVLSRFQMFLQSHFDGFWLRPAYFPDTRVVSSVLISSEPMFGGFLLSQGNKKREL